MASSQVEIASSSPFGYVLNNNNNRCCVSRDSNNFQKNFKNLIQSHLHSSISNQEFGGNNNNENNSKGANSSVSMPHPCQILKKYTSSGESETHPPTFSKSPSNIGGESETHPPTFSKSPSNIGGESETHPPLIFSKSPSDVAHEKWEKSRNMVFSMDKENQESFGGGGVSSLVRKWKDFETESIKSLNLLVGSPQKGFQESVESFGDWESEKISDMSKEEPEPEHDDVKESERLGVADIIKKLKFDNNNVVVAVNGGGSLPRVRTMTTGDHSEQQRCNFSPVLSSPRFIRGRQAFSDLLLQMERDRQRELDCLVEQVKDGQSVNLSASESNKSRHSSAIMHLREKFNTVGQHGFVVSRTTSKEVAKSIHEGGSLPSTPKRQQKENSYLDFKGLRRSPQRELARSSSAKEGTGFSLCQQNEKDPLTGLVKERSELHPGVPESRSTSIALGADTRDPGIFGKENRLKPTSPHNEVVDNKPKVGSVVESNRLQEENHHEEVRNKFSSRQQREGDRHQELDRGVEDSGSTPRALGETAIDLGTSKEESHHQPRNSHNEVVDSIPKVGVFCISNQLHEEKNYYEELCKKLSSRKVSISTEVTNLSENQKKIHDMDLNHQETNTSSLSCNSQVPSLDNISEKDGWANSSSEASHSNLLDFVDSGRRPKGRGANKQLPWTCNEWFSDCTNRQSDREEDSGSVSAYSVTASGWDEQQSNYQQDNEDWISSVSRPRKEWEGLREERYQEMLDPFSNNHDIRQLLHRKSVSLFLTSSLREDIDRIMASRSQQLPKSTSRHVEEEVSAQVAEDEEEVEQNAREEEDEVREEEEEEGDYDDDSEDDNSPDRQQYKEPEVLIHQSISLRTLRSWNTNPDQEVTDDSYHFPSPSSLQSQPRCSSSSGHPSTEMELIYEMRGHMEKLHEEIFEIRRSMKSCMNMQMKLHRSFKKDVAAALSQLGQMSKGNSDNKGSNKENCCVCHEDPVDSLLYRCGHMCTCFKCAHELISGTGKCPICQSPIMDVVRAHAYS